ncbi:hypothetical protein WJX74_007941 [Apatococcus lobatus]|uniref:Peptidase M3A/M3B catalytic domain-containing protein n=2 Tax=Apatococcus TaxID=904362 RepID=A0AAW1SQJ1_9CHLO
MLRALAGGHPSMIWSVRTAQVRSLQTAGLFGSEILRKPQNWSHAADDAIRRCKQTIQELLASPPSPQIIRLVDDVSDTVCQVTDSAEFCRLAHADAAWRSAATEACITLSGFIQELNTSKPLYEALIDSVDAFDNHAVEKAYATSGSGLSDDSPHEKEADPQAEALWVAAGLRRDFEAAGINLPDDRRAAADKMTAGIERLRMLIGWNVADPAQMAALPQAELPARAARHAGTARLDPSTAGNLLTNEPDGNTRKQAFQAFYHTPAQNVGMMHELMTERLRLAQLMGRRSFAHHVIGSHTLAGSPEAVQSFLDGLADQLKPLASQELQELKALKHSITSDQGSLKPEDQLFLLGKAKASQCEPILRLSLEGSLKGLSDLLERVFGLQLRRETIAEGEAWAPGIQKYALVGDNGLMGHIYVDAFARPGKPTQAGHYTLRCGRRCLNGTYQLPLVALSLGLAEGPLNLPELRTLFHEFGHALNSLLSRTEYQHFSGTRGPLDLVEVASHVMELFLEDPRVLLLMDHHSDQPLDPSTKVQKLEAWQRGGQRFRSLGLQHQIFLSRVDQRLHGSSLPPEDQVGDMISKIESEMTVFPFAASGAPVHARFLHLVSYSSRYYSYLYAECLAASIWQQFFAADPFDQDAGNHLRHALLEPGGARHPLQIMESLLGQDHMSTMSNGWGPPTDALLQRLVQTQLIGMH